MGERQLVTLLVGLFAVAAAGLAMFVAVHLVADLLQALQ